MSIDEDIETVQHLLELQDVENVDPLIYANAEADTATALDNLIFADIIYKTRQVTFGANGTELETWFEEWFQDTDKLPSFDHITFAANTPSIPECVKAIHGRPVRAVRILMNNQSPSIPQVCALIAPLYPQEVEFDVQGFPRPLSIRCFAEIFESLPNINSLSLINVQFMSYDRIPFQHIMHTALTRLTLVLSRFTLSKSDLLKHVLAAVPNITELVFHDDNSERTPREFENAPFFQNLTRFHLRTWHARQSFVRACYLRAISRMTSLREFTLETEECPAFFAAQTIAVLSNLDNIRRVHLNLTCITECVSDDDDVCTAELNSNSRIEHFTFSCKKFDEGVNFDAITQAIACVQNLSSIVWDVPATPQTVMHLHPMACRTLTQICVHDMCDEPNAMTSAFELASICPNLEEIDLRGNFFGIIAPPRINVRVSTIKLEATAASGAFLFYVLDAFQFLSTVQVLHLSHLASDVAYYQQLDALLKRACNINALLLGFNDDPNDSAVMRNKFPYLRQLTQLQKIQLNYSTMQHFSLADFFDSLTGNCELAGVRINCPDISYANEAEEAFMKVIYNTECLITDPNMLTPLTAARAFGVSLLKSNNYKLIRSSLVEQILHQLENNGTPTFFRRTN